MVSDSNVAIWNAKGRRLEPTKQTLMLDPNSQVWWPLSLCSFQLASTFRCIVVGLHLCNESGPTYRKPFEFDTINKEVHLFDTLAKEAAS